MSDTGSVKLGMIVAVKLRRNTKMTRDDEAERDEQRELDVMDRFANRLPTDPF